ncbi:MAG: PLP-dependent aspartate aminotransferase family protein [Thermoleophilia bacterium]|nr:PLP-dependent aspartate aminotransferase family protein [Thermoleophilia bacterium]
MRRETAAVHVGVAKDTAYNSVITPIYPSSTFCFDRVGENKGYDYTRSGNPTRTALEENLAALEGAGFARCTCTGMAAIVAVLFLLRQGDHVVAGHDIYGGTYRLFETLFPRFGVSFSFVDMCDESAVRSALRPETRMLWIETPSNPLLNIVDIAAMVAIAREHDVLTVADNTFLSPYFQRPLDLGVDVVLHSTTKYLNGHSDVVGGVVMATRADLVDRLGFIVNAMGLANSPFDAWLVLRGVKTLGPRMEAHQRGALALAAFLDGHPRVRRVYYPGLPHHPGHELAQRQQSGFGGMLSFDLDIEALDPDTFFGRLRYFSLAESLGGVESLIEQPWTMSHAGMGEEARRAAGISPGTMRVSVGIEHPDDLVEDMEQALR